MEENEYFFPPAYPNELQLYTIRIFPDQQHWLKQKIGETKIK